jgi:ubiquitin-protein ligase
MAGPSRQAANILRALEDLQKDLPEGITNIEAVDPNDAKVWRALFHGPQGSAYEGGKFKILIEFPPAFPFKPPTVRFDPPLFHPNVYEDGSVNINPDGATTWSPKSALGPVLSSISPMIANPNVDDKPANQDAANLYTSNIQEFTQKAKELTKMISQ